MGLGPPPRRSRITCGVTSSPLEKLLATQESTPSDHKLRGRYLLELAPDARKTLPTPAQDSESPPHDRERTRQGRAGEAVAYHIIDHMNTIDTPYPTGHRRPRVRARGLPGRDARSCSGGRAPTRSRSGGPTSGRHQHHVVLGVKPPSGRATSGPTRQLTSQASLEAPSSTQPRPGRSRRRSPSSSSSVPPRPPWPRPPVARPAPARRLHRAGPRRPRLAGHQAVQRYLHVRPASGYFGPVTKRAVVRWQAAHHRHRTGLVGKMLWQRTAPRHPRRAPVPSRSGDRVTGLNWAALARCESGGNPRRVQPRRLLRALPVHPVHLALGRRLRLPARASSREQTAGPRRCSVVRAPARGRCAAPASSADRAAASSSRSGCAACGESPPAHASAPTGIGSQNDTRR